jgi:hypothetical protein
VAVTLSWRTRLRFRLHKKLRIDAKERQLEIAGRVVALSPPTPDLKIADSEWLIMNARGFASKEEARDIWQQIERRS